MRGRRILIGRKNIKLQTIDGKNGCKYMEKENAHIVIKKEDVHKYLAPKDILALERILDTISRGRKKDGKNPCNNYIICNEDEPYAKKIYNDIVKHETTSYGKWVALGMCLDKYDTTKTYMDFLTEEKDEKMKRLLQLYKSEYLDEDLEKQKQIFPSISVENPEIGDLRVALAHIPLSKLSP